MSRRLIQAGLLVLCAAALAACSRGTPAPVEFRSAHPAPQQRVAEAETRAPLPGGAAPIASGIERRPTAHQDRIQPGVYVVRAGDSLFGISKRSQVALRDLIDANGLTPPYHLNANQSLTVPAVRYHLVQPGETVTAIAQAHSVSLRALVMANDIEPPYAIRAGERLRLPAPMQDDAAVVVAQVATRPNAEASERTTQVNAPANTTTPLVGTVRNGTGAGIAPVPAERPLGRGATPPLPAIKPGTQLVRAEPAPAVIPQPPRRAGRRFAWPVQGPVISRFGPKAGGFYNDGINIAVHAGTEVRAAENGVVTYVGNELRGFGNLVLIRHDGGWVTAYAHAAEINVKPGQIVRQGQVIARAGRSGRVNRPQLHFEIRKGRKAVDPLRHLPKPQGLADAAVPETVARPG